MILDDDVDLGAETTLAAKVDTQEGGMIKIRNEESISAFNIDINSLKTKDWKMDGDESDYFNYGFSKEFYRKQDNHSLDVSFDVTITSFFFLVSLIFTLPAISEIIATPFGFLASNNSSTLGRPCVISATPATPPE